MLEDQVAHARQLLGEAQAMVDRDIGTGVDVTSILEEALSLVEKVYSILGQLEQAEPQLQAEALRLDGDILFRVCREEEGVRSYLRFLSAASKAEELRDAAGEADESSWVMTASAPSHVHQVLAEYFLRQGLLERGLDHCGELIACTADEEARRQLLDKFRGIMGFQEATEGLTPSSMETMLETGKADFRVRRYESAGVRFEKVLRDARCIGEGSIEARALGNLGTVDYKTQRIPAAIRKYRTCVQLLRQQGNQATARKILNYLVLCCIETKRWASARLFHGQLFSLAESEQDIRRLTRLEHAIEKGMASQASAVVKQAPRVAREFFLNQPIRQERDVPQLQLHVGEPER